MRNMFFMVWWGRSTYQLIEEAYTPVVSNIISWSMQSFMKSSDLESSPYLSTQNIELL